MKQTWSDLNVAGVSPEAKYSKSKPQRGKSERKINRLWMFVMSLTFLTILVVVSARYESEPSAELEVETTAFATKLVQEAKDITEYVTRVARADTVVLTYVSFGYRSNLINWLVSLTRLEITNVAIVCLDQQLSEFLSAKTIPCFDLWKYERIPTETSARKGKRKDKLSLSSVKHLWIVRLIHLRRLLERGISVILSDTDAVWIKNPIKSGLLSPTMGDIVASRGQFPWAVSEAWGATICMGVVYFRSTSNVIRIVRRAEQSSKRTGDDQVSINLALFDRMKDKHQAFRLYESNMVGLSKYVKLNFAKDKTLAVGNFDKARVVLLPHTTVPRFCNLVKESDWKKNVYIAHCHSKDGEIAKTHKNWGDFEVHANIQEKYKLWCLADSQWESLKGKKFAEWLQVTSHSCSLPLA